MIVRINDREIGSGHSTYLVAEMSGNHNGDLERAIDTVHAAADAGADAIKLQTYTPDTMTIDSGLPDFVVKGEGPWSGRTLYELYQEAHTPWDWHGRLFETARSRGMEVFSTPFDGTAVDLLESLDAPAYKIASFELVDDALLRRVARTGKPLIVSTGMATLEEIAHALDVVREAGGEEVVFLRCTSSYPTPDASMRLATIPLLSKVTGCPVGLSDHSLGNAASIVAITLGACLIERHFTLSRRDGGVDSHFSLEPEEFKALVREARRAEAMIGTAGFGASVAERDSIVFRRSLYVTADIAAGETFTQDNVRSIRPGHGLPPRHLPGILGRQAAKPLRRGSALRWDMVQAAVDAGAVAAENQTGSG